MKKILLLILCLSTLSCIAQEMENIFVTMPKKLSLPLDSVNRRDLMDLYKEKPASAHIKNNLNGTSRLTSFGSHYLKLESESASTEIALLSMVNDSKVICLIKTACAPVCDSQLSFYTTEWKPLETDYFIRPVGWEWFVKENVNRTDQNYVNQIKSLDMDLMQYTFDPERMTLSQFYTTPEYLNKEERKKGESYLKMEPKIFEWKRMKFE